MVRASAILFDLKTYLSHSFRFFRIRNLSTKVLAGVSLLDELLHLARQLVGCLERQHEKQRNEQVANFIFMLPYPTNADHRDRYGCT